MCVGVVYRCVCFWCCCLILFVVFVVGGLVGLMLHWIMLVLLLQVVAVRLLFGFYVVGWVV